MDCISDGEIGLTARDVERANAQRQVNLQFAVRLPQRGDRGGNHESGEPLDRRHPNRACDARVASCGDALEILRGGLHRRALAQNGVSGRGGGKAVRRSIEQCHAETLLKESDTPPDRHVTDVQGASGCRQAASARHGKEDAHVVPLPGSRCPVH